MAYSVKKLEQNGLSASLSLTEAKCAQCGVLIEQVSEVSRCFWCVEPLCWKCHGMQYGQCTRCARQVNAVSEMAKLSRSMARRAKPIGRPPIMKDCPKCGLALSASDRRTHRCGQVMGICARCRLAYSEHENPKLCDGCYGVWILEHSRDYAG